MAQLQLVLTVPVVGTAAGCLIGIMQYYANPCMCLQLIYIIHWIYAFPGMVYVIYRAAFDGVAAPRQSGRGNMVKNNIKHMTVGTFVRGPIVSPSGTSSDVSIPFPSASICLSEPP